MKNQKEILRKVVRNILAESMENSTFSKFSKVKKALGNTPDFEENFIQLLPDEIINSTLDEIIKTNNLNDNLWFYIDAKNKSNDSDPSNVHYNYKSSMNENNLGHNEIWSIEPEGRFWIVTYKTSEGTKEKTCNSEEEAKDFTKNLNEGILNEDLDSSWLKAKYKIQYGSDVIDAEINTTLPYISVGKFFAQGQEADNIINEIHEIWIKGDDDMTEQKALETWIGYYLSPEDIL